MKKLNTLILVIGFSLCYAAYLNACSCIGAPNNFCASTNANDPYPLALLEVLSLDTSFNSTYFEEIYLEVLVLEKIKGQELVDTIRISIGNSALCESFIPATQGDTLIANLIDASFHGAHTYSVSLCGLNFLFLEQDTLRGPVAPDIEKMAYDDFLNQVGECYEVLPDFLAFGRLLQSNTKEQLRGFSFHLNGSSQTSSAGGDYGVSFINPNAADTFDLRFEKNDKPTIGLSSFDLLQIQKHILGLSSFDNPYSLLAADVNASGHISTLDIIFLQGLILGRIEALPKGDWLFIPATLKFENPKAPKREEVPFPIRSPYLPSPWYMEIFVVKVGDVNNSF